MKTSRRGELDEGGRKLLAGHFFCSLQTVGTDTDGQWLEWTALQSGPDQIPQPLGHRAGRRLAGASVPLM